MREAIYTRALQRAVQIKGGVRELAACLGTPMNLVAAWAGGMAPIPDDVFLKVVDILFEQTVDELGGRASAKPGRSP